MALAVGTLMFLYVLHPGVGVAALGSGFVYVYTSRRNFRRGMGYTNRDRDYGISAPFSLAMGGRTGASQPANRKDEQSDDYHQRQQGYEDRNKGDTKRSEELEGCKKGVAQASGQSGALQT